MPEDPKPEGAPKPAAEPSQPAPPQEAPLPSADPPAPPAVPKPAAAAPAAKPAVPPKPPAPKVPAVMQTSPWEGDLPDLLKSAFGDRITEYLEYVGQRFLVARTGSVIPVLQFLKTEAAFDYLVDVTAVDYPDKPERFELIYILYSFARNERIRIKTRIKDGERPATAVPVHVTANWLEREVFDMFGIEFEGHPDMKRILLPDEWSGHPLRKDYNILKMDEHWVQENLGIESGQ